MYAVSIGVPPRICQTIFVITCGARIGILPVSRMIYNDRISVFIHGKAVVPWSKDSFVLTFLRGIFREYPLYHSAGQIRRRQKGSLVFVPALWIHQIILQVSIDKTYTIMHIHGGTGIGYKNPPVMKKHSRPLFDILFASQIPLKRSIWTGYLNSWTRRRRQVFWIYCGNEYFGISRSDIITLPIVLKICSVKGSYFLVICGLTDISIVLPIVLIH